MPKLAKTFNGNLEQALAADSEHLYIGNNLKGHAVLLLDIKDNNGKAVCVRLPRTWVPIDLMLFADREAIKRSESVRKLHRKGAIKFLDPTESNEIMKSQEAIKEANRAGLLGGFVLSEESEARVEEKKEEVDISVDDIQYYKNIIEELKSLSKEEDEEVIVNKIKDMESTYFSDPDSVNKGNLIMILNDAKSFLSDSGKSNASEEIQSMISSIEE